LCPLAPVTDQVPSRKRTICRGKRAPLGVPTGTLERVTPAPSALASAGNLYQGFEAYRTHSDDELREVLRRALVVLDTNVLLNLYVTVQVPSGVAG